MPQAEEGSIMSDMLRANQSNNLVPTAMPPSVHNYAPMVSSIASNKSNEYIRITAPISGQTGQSAKGIQRDLEMIITSQSVRIAALEKQLESRNHDLAAVTAEFSSVVESKNQTIESLNERLVSHQNLREQQQQQQQQQPRQQHQTANHPMHQFSHRELISILDAKIHELATLKSDFEEQKAWYKNAFTDLEHKLKMQETSFIEKSQEVEKLRQEKIAQENRFLLQVADMKRREQWKPEKIAGSVPEQNLTARVLQLESQEKSMMTVINVLKVERARERSAVINLQAELTQAHKEVDSMKAKLNLLNEPLVLDALGGKIQEGLVGLVFQKEEEIVTLKREVEHLRNSKQVSDDRNEEESVVPAGEAPGSNSGYRKVSLRGREA
ncbi:hypothetical protein HDU83_002632 [Entophlyctis luteolus]|nr:hypothetical protein HDU83_002632 [Entophlyctis luteolus]